MIKSCDGIKRKVVYYGGGVVTMGFYIPLTRKKEKEKKKGIRPCRRVFYYSFTIRILHL